MAGPRTDPRYDPPSEPDSACTSLRWSGARRTSTPRATRRRRHGGAVHQGRRSDGFGRPGLGARGLPPASCGGALPATSRDRFTRSARAAKRASAVRTEPRRALALLGNDRRSDTRRRHRSASCVAAHRPVRSGNGRPRLSRRSSASACVRVRPSAIDGRRFRPIRRLTRRPSTRHDPYQVSRPVESARTKSRPEP